jgi:hypothetical protein
MDDSKTGLLLPSRYLSSEWTENIRNHVCVFSPPSKILEYKILLEGSKNPLFIKLISEKLAQKSRRHETWKLLEAYEIPEDTYEIVLKLVPNLLTCMNFIIVFKFPSIFGPNNLETNRNFLEILSTLMKSCRHL